MLIRSQSGNSLINLNHSVGLGIKESFEGILIVGESTTDDYKLGKYSSTEKALKVLDMIEKKYLSYASIESGFYGTHGIFNLPKVFKMPADDEVEV